MKMKSLFPDIEHTTQHQIDLAIGHLEQAKKQSNPEKMPCVYLSGAGNVVTFMPAYATGPDHEDIWLCMLKALKEMAEGKSRLFIQHRPNDYESRMTPLCPVELLNKMIETIENKNDL